MAKKIQDFEYGWSQAVPAYAKAAWGARAYFEESNPGRGGLNYRMQGYTPRNVIIPPNRQSIMATGSGATKLSDLQAALNAAMPAIAKGLLKSNAPFMPEKSLKSRPTKQDVIYENSRIKVVGRYRGGYFYLAAWFKPKKKKKKGRIPASPRNPASFGGGLLAHAQRDKIQSTFLRRSDVVLRQMPQGRPHKYVFEPKVYKLFIAKGSDYVQTFAIGTVQQSYDTRKQGFGSWKRPWMYNLRGGNEHFADTRREAVMGLLKLHNREAAKRKKR